MVLNLMVDDVDDVFAKGLAAGAQEIFAVADQFYGHRTGRLRDPFGHHWILATQVEDVSDAETVKRFQALF